MDVSLLEVDWTDLNLKLITTRKNRNHLETKKTPSDELFHRITIFFVAPLFHIKYCATLHPLISDNIRIYR